MNQPSEPLRPESADAGTARSASAETNSDRPAGDASRAEPAIDRFRRGVSEHRGTDEPPQEKSLWSGGYSSRAMTGVWLGLALLTVALVIGAVLFEEFPLLWAIGIAAVLWVLGLCVYAVRRLSIHYELTTQRFIHQHGLLSRRTDRIEVIDINDIGFVQGPIERLLGIGTIDVTSTDVSHPHLVMPGIHEVKRVAGLIDDVRRRERERRSLHIRSM